MGNYQGKKIKSILYATALSVNRTGVSDNSRLRLQRSSTNVNNILPLNVIIESWHRVITHT